MSAGGSPCGACKFLRRKCVADCVFAPYFDSDEGTAHFTAVHRVFGASNTSKLLSKIPANRRLDAVFTICYEALARINDPVYGCVGHIFALQNQVMNLQTELAIVQNQLSTLQHFIPPNLQNSSLTSSSNVSLVDNNNNNNKNNVSSSLLHNHFTMSEQEQQRQEDHSKVSTESMNFTTLLGLEDYVVDEDGELNSYAHEFFSKYLTGSKSRPSSPTI